jgi:response regulator RpfG family c-di-GMP phosphodiesterase
MAISLIKLTRQPLYNSKRLLGMNRLLEHYGAHVEGAYHPMKKYTLLVVDDEPDNLLLLERVLRREYNVLAANSGAEALEMLGHVDVDMIISDQRMPGMTGAELLGEAYKRNPDQMRLLLTAYADIKDIISAINSGHIYQYISKPWDPDELKLLVRRTLESYQLTLDNRRMLAEYRSNEALALSVFANLVAKLESRSPKHHGQTHRIKEYATLLARELKLFGEEMAQLEAAACLRNLGLLTLPDAVLCAADETLTPSQREQLASQNALTAEILMPLPFFIQALPIIDTLAERMDGQGPRGLKDDAIPLLARILAVAVAYDALAQDGQPDTALLALKALGGTRLDAKLVERFERAVLDNLEAASCPG